MFSRVRNRDDPGMTQAAQTLIKATMAALDLAVEGEVPEWVHLLPTSKGKIQTGDKRGPYDVADAEAIIAASFADQPKLQIDENHAEDLKSGKGEPSPARGWITELQARADGIWGRVEWTGAGRALVADKAYRAMSPVILHDKAKRVIAILRASLVNRPNFRGLATLNQETSMDAMAQMAAALGLAEGASADDILAAIKALKDKSAGDKAAGDKGDMPALQSALAEIGVALGVEGEANPATIVAAAKLAKGGKESLVALQAQVTGLTSELTTLKTAGARTASEGYVRGEIAKGRLIPANAVEDMISLHMSNPTLAVKMVEGALMGAATHAGAPPPAAKDGTVALNAAQIEACAVLGMPQADYAAHLAQMQKENRA